MYIKWLEIYGFKSFCEKTRIELQKGITAIVGPNGCGKSNITDAIRWALGEQSLKILRAAKQEDLIFAGTEKRKSQGFAEVSICFDNSNGILPIDYQEVVITRRLFRSGESEFFINKTPCRLKDVYELFLDSGLGKDGYSVISQGKVDEIINARPVERYRIFEEACGITKYKYRKEETERKLKTTEENIQRLQDVMFELSTQLEEIKPDVQKAKIYLQINQKLQSLKKEKYVYEYNLTGRRYNDLLFKEKQLNEELEKFVHLRKEFEESINQSKLQMDMLNKHIEQTKLSYNDIKNELTEATTHLKFLKKQLENKQQLKEDLSSQILQLERQKEELKKSIEELQKGISEKEEEHRSILEVHTKLQKQIAALKENITEVEVEIQKKETELIECISQIEKFNQKLNGILHLSTTLENRKEKIIEQTNAILSELEKLTVAQDTKKSKLMELDNERKKLVILLEDLNQQVSEKEGHLANIRNLVDDLSKQLIKKQERLSVLKIMEESYEGYSKTIKEIFKRVKNLPICLYGTVGSLISVKREYLKAIETALSTSLQHLVVKNEDDAKRIIEIAKNEKLGKVTIIPVDVISVLAQKEDINADGFLGFADEFVDVNDELRKVVEFLLGRTLVFDTIDKAIEYQKKVGYKARCVTLSGELISPGGVFVGGEKKADFSLLGRKVEKEELEVDVKNLLSKLEEMDKLIVESSKVLYDLKTAKQEAEENLNDLLSKMNELEREIDMYDYKIKQLAQNKDALENEKNLIFEQLITLEYDIKSSQENLKNLKKSKEELEKDISNLKTVLNKLKEDYNILDSKFTKAIEDKNKIEAEISILNHKLETQSYSMAEVENRKIRCFNEKEKCEKEIKDIEEQIYHTSAEIEEKKKKVEEFKSSLQSFDKDYLELSERYNSEQKRLSETLSKIQEIEKKLGQIALEKHDHENYMKNIKEKYFETFNEEIHTSNREIFWSKEKEDELERCTAALSELGEVKLYSIDQEKRLQERMQFLQKQIEDLQKTTDELKRLISHLEKNMKEIFLENFEKIKSLFSEIFFELFGGGSCDLKLIGQDGELGVDIDVKPPGKKLQNINLLSGGEKALVAIALLFAFLTFKGSLLCILDEIDSSLDEANVQRFAQYIKNLNSQSQIIIVTHRKPTMEIADILYGVTMEERGVSKILSLNIEKIQKG